MYKLTALCCVLLFAGSVSAFPGSSWRREAQDYHPDRDVEEVEPVRAGGSRGRLAPPQQDSEASEGSDETPIVIPFSIGIRGLGGLGGLGGGRPVLAIRPLDVAEDSDEEAGYGGGSGFVHPYFVDPMTRFMAQMAEMLAALRRQMTDVIEREPTDISKLGNTTSTTKVIDGHVITVNETIIKGDNEEIHVRVVDISPSVAPEGAPESTEDGKDTPKVTEDTKDVESMGSDEEVTKKSRAENEIPMKVGSEVDDLNA